MFQIFLHFHYFDIPNLTLLHSDFNNKLLLSFYIINCYKNTNISTMRNFAKFVSISINAILPGLGSGTKLFF